MQKSEQKLNVASCHTHTQSEREKERGETFVIKVLRHIFCGHKFYTAPFMGLHHLYRVK